ncbi:helix-turn-helix transcriptional regulator [Streptomyces piniterrae]|uniref:Helix-turn-helix transcriptional regulator n=1 Tax=Streptomyces piniterrae TaxID=2571125 RepID=A0A4U0MY32_9ACTN|nr:helix-turn-helix transcriptional regulator [Streptomyces piniterrae]TJZ46075.1 helix-turn-helix transcriptional regulator [Streptomyces piniterrae]
MPVNTHAGDQRRPPFNAESARRLREALGMTPAHVAYGIAAAYGLRISPATVASWELGETSPTETELTALAGALWCAPGELLGAPGTLREYRLATGLAPDDLARRIGMDQSSYDALEAGGVWRGNDRQAAALAEVLDLPLPALVRFTGQESHLTEMLTSAATTRWQGYVRPVQKVVPLPKQQIQDALEDLFAEYHDIMAASLNWGNGGSSVESGRAGRAFLDRIVAEFWERVGLSG